MIDFRVELHRPSGFLQNVVSRHFHLLAAGNNMVVVRKLQDGIAVRHPHLALLRDPFQQHIVFFHVGEVGAAVLAGGAGTDGAATNLRQILGAVADAEQRIMASDFRQIRFEGVGVVHRERTSGKDNALDVRVSKRELVVRQDFAIGVQLADATRNELRVLGTEV